nr:MAG TPA: hypothetical protein [Caudoviricetes sp.]
MRFKRVFRLNYQQTPLNPIISRNAAIINFLCVNRPLPVSKYFFRSRTIRTLRTMVADLPNDWIALARSRRSFFLPVISAEILQIAGGKFYVKRS